MSPTQSVTLWLQQFKAGDRAAVQHLWDSYFARLVGLARAWLRAASRRAADEEDVALSAFDSFCRAAETGRFPRLEDRDDLWQVLVLLASRKAANLAGHEQRQKRGGGKVIQSLDAPAGSASDDAAWFGALIGKEPDPAVAAEVAEECRRPRQP